MSISGNGMHQFIRCIFHGKDAPFSNFHISWNMINMQTLLFALWRCQDDKLCINFLFMKISTQNDAFKTMCASNDLHCIVSTSHQGEIEKQNGICIHFADRFTHQISSTPQNILVAVPSHITSAQGHKFCIYKCICSTFLDAGSHFIEL